MDERTKIMDIVLGNTQKIAEEAERSLNAIQLPDDYDNTVWNLDVSFVVKSFTRNAKQNKVLLPYLVPEAPDISEDVLKESLSLVPACFGNVGHTTYYNSLKEIVRKTCMPMATRMQRYSSQGVIHEDALMFGILQGSYATIAFKFEDSNRYLPVTFYSNTYGLNELKSMDLRPDIHGKVRKVQHLPLTPRSRVYMCRGSVNSLEESWFNGDIRPNFHKAMDPGFVTILGHTMSLTGINDIKPMSDFLPVFTPEHLNDESANILMRTNQDIDIHNVLGGLLQPLSSDARKDMEKYCDENWGKNYFTYLVWVGSRLHAHIEKMDIPKKRKEALKADIKTFIKSDDKWLDRCMPLADNEDYVAITPKIYELYMYRILSSAGLRIGGQRVS